MRRIYYLFVVGLLLLVCGILIGERIAKAAGPQTVKIANPIGIFGEEVYLQAVTVGDHECVVLMTAVRGNHRLWCAR